MGKSSASSAYYDALVGKEIKGKYRIDRKLGSGGMGAVFEAVSIPEGNRVALKVIAPRLASNSKFVKRFLREARVGTVLSHPNIIKVHEFGEAEDSMLFMVMEFAEGETLKTYLVQTGALAPERCRQIFEQLCNALKTAHKRNILHRDLKPENILLAKDETGKETLKLADFGLLKLTQPDEEISAGGENLTQIGEMFGTPFYISPEQALGQTVDTTSDIYSLGVILYQMLTGRLPIFDNQLQRLLMLKASNPPEPPSKRLPSLTDRFDEVVLKAMAISPEDRYQSVEEFYEAFIEAMASNRGEGSGAIPVKISSANENEAPAIINSPSIAEQPAPYTTTVLELPERNFIQRLKDFFKKMFG